MEVRITYKGTLDGVYGVWTDTYPEEAEITEEISVLYPAPGKVLEKDGEQFPYVILEEGEDIHSYIEVNESDPSYELKLTRGDVFRGLLQAKGIKRTQLRAMLEAMPETTDEEKLIKELALIDFDEALYFYRANPLIDKIGTQLNISKSQLTKFFETNDYRQLM